MPKLPVAFALFVSGALAASTVGAAPGLKSDEREDQQAAVELVERLGGRVLYDYQRPNPARPNVHDPRARPTDPDRFHQVVFVNLRGTKVSDDHLRALGKLPALENLDLTDTAITGNGLAHLKALTGMRYLGLWNTRVDDAGLEHLKGMTRMWALILDGTQVTDRGLEHLAGMTEMEEWLGLGETRVTDSGLKCLEGMTKLRNLNLTKTKVTADGVAALRAKLTRADVSFDR